LGHRWLLLGLSWPALASHLDISSGISAARAVSHDRIGLRWIPEGRNESKWPAEDPARQLLTGLVLANPLLDA
jgi:hypothetical protein